MTEARHTPGPWKVCRNGNGDLCIGTNEDDPWFIAEMCLGAQGEDVPVDPAEANARLIAAAPALLDALHVMLAATEDSIGKRFRDRAKRAIAKAEGR